ncbi:hypothetical protein EDB80DRAFT_820390 [Ilyonectria destructans]|nr:hypothetical protein EDB80DRAFT_820390 [Ilyonectria destructans]
MSLLSTMLPQSINFVKLEPSSLARLTWMSSINCPASHAALFGFVAPRDLVSNHGLFPVSTFFDRPGILSKSTVDLASVLGIIAQPTEPLTQDIASSNYRVADSAVWADFGVGWADLDFFRKTHGLYHDETGEVEMYEAVQRP